MFPSIVYTVRYTWTLHTVHYTLYTVHCTLHCLPKKYFYLKSELGYIFFLKGKRTRMQMWKRKISETRETLATEITIETSSTIEMKIVSGLKSLRIDGVECGEDKVVDEVEEEGAEVDRMQEDRIDGSKTQLVITEIIGTDPKALILFRLKRVEDETPGSLVEPRILYLFTVLAPVKDLKHVQIDLLKIFSKTPNLQELAMTQGTLRD